MQTDINPNNIYFSQGSINAFFSNVPFTIYETVESLSQNNSKKIHQNFPLKITLLYFSREIIINFLLTFSIEDSCDNFVFSRNHIFAKNDCALYFTQKIFNMKLIIFTLLLCSSIAASISVQTDKGIVIGCQEDGLNIHKGVPYAAPPVGNLRWRSPQVTPPKNPQLNKGILSRNTLNGNL